MAGVENMDPVLDAGLSSTYLALIAIDDECSSYSMCYLISTIQPVRSINEPLVCCAQEGFCSNGGG
jgi:hypothetical protein